MVDCEVCGIEFDEGDSSAEFGFACEDCEGDPSTYDLFSGDDEEDEDEY